MFRTLATTLYIGFMLTLYSSFAQNNDPTTITVMSYNIGYGQNGIDNVATLIREVNPDIVGLQEVDVHWSQRSDFIDQAEYLATVLDMHLFYAPIYMLPDTVESGRLRQFGLAFLSKYPFIETVNHPISRLSTQDTGATTVNLPGFPQVTVQIGDYQLTLFNTHLDFRSDPWVREIQVAEMLAITDRTTNPKILMGDFNAKPDAEALQPIFNAFRNASAAEPSLLFTFPSENALRQIDYITHSSHFSLDTVYVVQTTASDHLPIIAKLILKAD